MADRALPACVGVALLAAALSAAGQRVSAVTRIAFLGSEDSCAANRGRAALVDGLRALGYREGQEVVIECRSAEGRSERLDALAAELVQQDPAVIVAAAAPASLAAKRASRTIPIVSAYAADPIGLGIVDNLARPSGNVTGISALASEHAAKSLQLLKEIAPRTTRVGVIGHAGNPTYAIYRRELESAARTVGLAIEFAGIEAAADIDPALSALVRRGADAFFVMHQPLTFVQRKAIVASIARHRLPAMHGSREAVADGGLVSYAVSVADTFRRSAYFVDRILRGARPGDLPFEQPTKFELVVNTVTAKTLGMRIPDAILVAADVIDR